MNKFVGEGREISAFIKNTDRIWEGTLISRSDGTMIVLNESTKKWRKLSDLEKIKLIESDTEATYEAFMGAMKDNLDPDKMDDKIVKDAAKEIEGLKLDGTPDNDSIITDLNNEQIMAVKLL
jgi:hypothetical protein